MIIRAQRFFGSFSEYIPIRDDGVLRDDSL